MTYMLHREVVRKNFSIGGRFVKAFLRMGEIKVFIQRLGVCLKVLKPRMREWSHGELNRIDYYIGSLRSWYCQLLLSLI